MDGFHTDDEDDTPFYFRLQSNITAALVTTVPGANTPVYELNYTTPHGFQICFNKIKVKHFLTFPEDVFKVRTNSWGNN